MGYVITCDEKEVWKPSLVVGNLFYEQVQSLEKIVGQPSGIISPYDDELEVSKDEFKSFLLACVKFSSESNNVQLKALMSGCLEVSLYLYNLISASGLELPPDMLAIQDKARMMANI